jgi:hypothetical protein
MIRSASQNHNEYFNRNAERQGTLNEKQYKKQRSISSCMKY